MGEEDKYMMTLDEAIIYCEEKTDCTECGMEHKQLGNWLKMLKKYIDLDTPKCVKEETLHGYPICPTCGRVMLLCAVRCNCGQRIRY